MVIWQDKEIAMQDFVGHHIIWAVRGGVADADGNEDLSRRLYAETKLRLIRMSDEELWQLPKVTSSLPISNQLFILIYPIFLPSRAILNNNSPAFT